MPERSSYYLIAGAKSHVDATIALPASVSRFVALRLLLAEGARLDLIARHAGLNQRVTNSVDDVRSDPGCVGRCRAHPRSRRYPHSWAHSA